MAFRTKKLVEPAFDCVIGRL